MDPDKAARIADALLEPERQRQHRQRQAHLARRWNGQQILYRNRRAVALALAAMLVAAVLAWVTGALPGQDLAALAGWKRLAAGVGLPAWLLGMVLFRPPPPPRHLEEL